jgi:ABC-type multidrug transport system ATPase subunit
VLVLDEPTTGVDAVSRNEFWRMLGRLKQEDITIIVATPYMDEANSCDRVALMQKGRMLQVDSPDQIARSFDKDLFAVRSPRKYQALKALKSYQKLASVHPFGDSIHVAAKSDSVNVEQIVRFLRSRGIQVEHISPVDPSIEDRFMDLMQTQEDESSH